MNKFILTPPIAFLIMLATMMLFAGLLSVLSFKRKTKNLDIGKPYACGEETPSTLVQPNYSEFFPFAFFFTILHVMVLMVATIPAETLGSLAIAVIYILGAATGLFILFRR